MKKGRKIVCFLIACTVFLSVLGSISYAQLTYSFEQLGTYEPFTSHAFAVNSSGQVVGTWYDDLNYTSTAFFWDGKTSNIGDAWSYGYDINDAGQAVGCSNIQKRGFLWDSNNGMQYLDTLGGSSSCAGSINNAGQVVGTSKTSNNSSHAFLWDSSNGMQDLGTLGGNHSSAGAINDAGQVVGTSYISGSLSQHAFLWDSTNGMQDLGTLGGSHSYAYNINNYGQVVGYSSTSDGQQHAFLWDSTNGMQDLGTLGGNFSRANAINDSGQVVGFSYTSTGLQRPFLWDENMGMIDLNSLMISEFGLQFLWAGDINMYGQIVGVGQGRIDSSAQAYLLTPVVAPEPVSLILFVTGGVLLAGRRYLRR